MSRVCQVTGKRPVSGNNVSHANNKTRRRFLPNLHTHRFWLESENRFVRLRVSNKGLRIIDKLGIDNDILNVNGGSISIGHPYGMTGARCAGHLLMEMGRRKAKRGVVTMCVGGGQGMAMIIQRLS